jgi:TIR domain
MEKPRLERDIFISHASEDKAAIARPLAEKLVAAGLDVWLDEYEISLGDSLRAKLDEGLRASRFGVVVLSKAFFAKEWPVRELNALIGMETSSRKVILPIWHEIERADVQRFSPLLVDKIAIRSSEGLENVVKAILRAYGATNSRGVFRVFSYNSDHVKRQQHMGLEYLSLTAGGDQASVELHFSYNKEFDASIHGKQLHAFADEFWEPALRIMCSLVPMTPVKGPVRASRYPP